MKAKGCISDILEWRTSREFFYWRIRRRQLEDELKDSLVSASGGQLDYPKAAERINVCYGTTATQGDQAVVKWFETNNAAVDNLVKKTRLEFVASSALKAMEGLSPAEKLEVSKQISDLMK